MHITVTIYHTIISKFQNFKKIKNNPIVKAQARLVISCLMTACNLKTIRWKLRRRGIYNYYILYHYFKISKIRQKFKNTPIVKKNINQVNDIMLDACVQFENYPIKTVGEEVF